VLSVSFTARDHSPVAGLSYCFVYVVWLIAFLLLVSLTTFSFASFQQIKRKRKKITVSVWVAFQSTFFLLKRHQHDHDDDEDDDGHDDDAAALFI
jgi:hypothetical protein